MKEDIERQVIYWDKNRTFYPDLGSYSFYFSTDMSQDAEFYHRKDDEIKFKIFPENEEVERLLAPIFNMENSYRNNDNFNSSIKLLIESISRSTYHEGQVYFELCILDGKFKLIEVNSYLIKDIFGKYFQILPKKFKSNILRINFLQNIFKFTFPTKLGGEKKLKRLKLILSQKDTFFTLQQYVYGNNDKYYDFEYIKKQDDITVLKNFFDFGWYKRGLAYNEFTEYTNIKLLLNKKKTSAIVRHDVLNQINKVLLPSILKRMHIKDYNNYSIIVENMKAEDYFQNLLYDLEQGHKLIDELYDIVYDNS